MKIAQVCPRYYPSIGGVEEHVRNISERLVRDHDVSVFTTDPSGRLSKVEIIEGVKVNRFKAWAPNEAYYFSRELKKYLTENSDSFDIVHAHNYHAFPALYATQAKNRNKLVFTPHYHGKGHTFFRSLLHKQYRFLGRRIFEKADKVICVSNHEKTLVAKHFEVGDEKVVVIRNGVNLDEFKLLEKRTKGCRNILSVGRLEKYKGIQYLIEVLPRLDQDIILEVVGKGPFKENLVKLARKHDVEDRVKFHQDLPRQELLQLYADADLFVLLSKHEAYGLSVAEAMCAGTPCIVSKTSALIEWVDDDNCFGIDSPGDLNTLRSLITSVMGKRVRGSKIWDWGEVVEKLVGVYENCLY